MRRVARPWPALGWVLLTLLLTLWPIAAHAAVDDQVDSFTVDYHVQPDGTVQVTEQIVLRFGASSERRGLERLLITRAPYDGADDMLFEVSDPMVSSPGQVSTAVSVQRNLGEGRNRYLRVRVGDANRRIYAPTATYRLTYTVRGALRSYTSYDEFYWNVTGTGLPRVLSASVSLRVPGGVREVFCTTGTGGDATNCHSTGIDKGVGTFRAFSVPADSPLTVAAKLRPGSVADGGPILVESADLSQRRSDLATLIGGGVAAAVVPLLGWWYYRRHGYDRRYMDLEPGTAAGPEQDVPEVRDRGVPVPVVKGPPALPLAEAGLLLEGQPHPRQTTATLVSLAVDGAIRLRGGSDPGIRLIDARRAGDRSSAVLLEELFDGAGTVADLTSTGLIAEGHDRITAMAQQTARDENWFVRLPSPRTAGNSVITALAMGYILYTLAGRTALLLIPLLISVVATLVVLNRKLRRGQRTGRGRALTDRVEGFRTFLATAEADQLQAEAGDDVFSRYLPWAVLFDLTDRWTRLGQHLVEQGRLPSTPPAWYDGTAWDFDAFAGQVSALTASVSAATTAPDFSEGPPFSSRSGLGASAGESSDRVGDTPGANAR